MDSNLKYKQSVSILIKELKDKISILLTFAALKSIFNTCLYTILFLNVFFSCYIDRLVLKHSVCNEDRACARDCPVGKIN